MAKKSKTGQWGLRRIGKRKGTYGDLNIYESKAQPFEFGYGTVWATSQEEAKRKLKKILRGMKK